MSESIDLDAYLQRIGSPGAGPPTLATLRALHRLHPTAIPFENLDVLLGRGVRLDLASLQAKLVAGRRGGYCFEHNALFAAALRALGFEVVGLGARVVWMSGGGPLPPRTHMLLRVETEAGPRIADVGFGGFTLTAPLTFETGVEQDTGHGVFRLTEVEDDLQLEARLPDRWEPMYRFGPQAQAPADYELANWYVSTHPASRHTSALIAAWVDDTRRFGLRNGQLSIHHRGGPSEKLSLGAAEVETLLHETFGLARPDADLQALYAKWVAMT
jgi:N-hydroxyarylamine O-acetyltransferase